MANGSLDESIERESATTSKWGEDLTRYDSKGEYRLMHTAILAGDLSTARLLYQSMSQRAGEVAEGLGQMLNPAMYLGPHAEKIQRELYQENAKN